MYKSTLTILLICLTQLTWAQKTAPTYPKGAPIYAPLEKLAPIPNTNQYSQQFSSRIPTTLHALSPNTAKNVHVETVGKNGLPSFIRAQFDITPSLSSIEKAYTFLTNVKGLMHIVNPRDEFELIHSSTDKLGNKHLKFEQRYRGVKINGAEIILHEYNGNMQVMNGHYIATPKNLDVTPQFDKATNRTNILEDASTKFSTYTIPPSSLKLIDGPQYKSTLCVYSEHFRSEENILAYYSEFYPNIGEKIAYITNAQTGEIIKQYSLLCKFAHEAGHKHSNLDSSPPPPSVSNGTDLAGTNQTFNTYQSGGQNYLIDATKSMFNAGQSNMPDEPIGAIWTINAFNTSPQNNNFNYDHIKSSSTNWSNNATNRTAISAHYNAGEAYEYYKNTHNRNSINGSGGNIISIVNVSESNGQAMDNAFWNGQAMFYGNGNQAFSPLAEALDVAGHELTHGVVQKTANLAYQGESGAINESMADIFGAMIDRDNWTMGEDIVNQSVFPSGALRDLSNPHNGGNSLGDPGYQPANTSEQYTGNQDNGGVHINSGIANKAFYLIASVIGKDKAELIYYNALTNYLTMSSQFLDLRAAVTESTNQLYGNTELNAVNNAFNTVQIGSSGGSTTGEAYQIDINPNPGSEYIIAVPTNYIDIDLYDGDGNWLSTLSNETVLSKPSITDDGTAIVFIAGDHTMHAIFIDWGNNSFQETVLNDQPVWRNISVAKDGSRIAALVDQEENKIHVYDFTLDTWDEFELYNPTFVQGQTTGDVLYADVLEWDFSSNNLVYDSFNRINGTNGSIDYWDVGFINVFEGNNFASGDISKLFSQLPDAASIGNPTFAKNSPYILAFDYFENSNNVYQVLAANLETGDVGLIFDNVRLGYPNYNRLDDTMLFEAETNGGDVVLATVGLSSNKIEANGDAAVLINAAQLGSYFANGIRSLDVSTKDLEINNDLLKILPNPVTDKFLAQFTGIEKGKASLEVYDIQGKKVLEQTVQILEGLNTIKLNASGWSSGTYKLVIKTKKHISTQSIIRK